MNVRLLIDMVMRQTTVLIAQLATTGGIRAPLSRVANQVFLNLNNELASQGVGRKVVADMFGLALRSYQMKVRRLTESATESDRSLWEAVLDFVSESEGVTRREVVDRFRFDDQSSVRGILRDLVDTRLVSMTGRGNDTFFRVTTDEDRIAGSESMDDEAASALIWITVYREGPIARDVLESRFQLGHERLDRLLEGLFLEQRVQQDEADPSLLRSHTCVVTLEEAFGWEAALFDHFQAIVNAITMKLRGGRRTANSADILGGSTYSFDVWPGHPLEDRVLGLLRETREHLSELHAAVVAHNDEHRTLDADGVSKVTFYLGQSVRQPHGIDEDRREP